MIAIKRRRLVGGCVVVLVAALLLFASVVADAALRTTSYYSGWGLLVIVLVLALFSARKKLSPLPVGTAFAWLQLHTYLGLISVVAFLVHLRWTLPSGALEVTLAVVFLLVAVTGLAGLVLSRILAPRLSRRGDEVIFERIPGFTHSVRRRAEQLVLKSIEPTIADFYQRRLAAYFARPRHLVGHLFGSSRGSHSLVAELRALDRYLNQAERETREKLERVILQKDDLDIHYALQAALKYWLFVHIPLTYSLVLLVSLHVLVVYGFSGRLP